MPQVHVHLYATFRAYIGGAASTDVEITPGETVRDVLVKLGVPPGQTRIIFVNSRAGELSQPLEGGETLGIFPAIGGG